MRAKWACRGHSASVGWLAVASLTLALSGCTELKTEYGRSTGVEGEQSLSGFGVLRDVYRREGWDDRTVARLSERLNNVDTIIWTPTVESPPVQEVIDWLEQWLERGDKTLVYVLRDYQTESAYWRQAAKHAVPEQRIEYRRRVARAQLEYLHRLLQRPSMITNGWFTAIPAEPTEPIGETAGPWGPAVGQFGPLGGVEYRLRAFKEGDQNTSPPTFSPGNITTVWDTGVSETDVEFEPLLTTETGSPVVARVSDETWNDSQILVVAGGSLLNNFGLLEPASQRLAMQIVAEGEETGDSKTVGFLYSDEAGVMVSSLDPSKMGPSGLEMLTAWPLNLVTIHAAVLGLVVCLMLLPIFGRPRRLAPRSSTDFAIHVDAVAALMARTADETYARARISEYMTRVRGETEGPWVLNPPAEPVATSATAAPTGVPTTLAAAATGSLQPSGPAEPSPLLPDAHAADRQDAEPPSSGSSTAALPSEPSLPPATAGEFPEKPHGESHGESLEKSHDESQGESFEAGPETPTDRNPAP